MASLANPYLEYRSGELACEGSELRSLAVRHGTPLYVYSQAAILDNFGQYRRGLGAIPAEVCYSVKANSSLSVLKLLAQAGAGFDIVSGGELARVVKIAADPARIVFSGVGKTEAEIDAALHAQILMFNVESAGELELLRARARHLGKRAPVSIRVNPDVEAETHPYISTGQAMHKFGVPKAEALALYEQIRRAPETEIRGIACHIGSQILDYDPFLKAFDEIKSMADSLAASGVAVRRLDIGGGFGIRYCEEPPLDFSALTEGLASRIRGTRYRLIVEPGRSIVGNAGLLLTRVLYVKRNLSKNFIVVDSGMNDLLRPSLYGSFHDIVPVRQTENGKHVADVVGPICETGDFLAREREMPETQPGDLLAILTAGAYGYSLASNYNSRPRPAEVLVDGKESRL
ncbi:MAG: diaminopimelate decarboxylase, partial [Acidobacteriota bacterium]|nr:diaminopimelate decarboxylase [Acidobacteriota bacterium]